MQKFILICSRRIVIVLGGSAKYVLYSATHLPRCWIQRN